MGLNLLRFAITALIVCLIMTTEVLFSLTLGHKFFYAIALPVLILFFVRKWLLRCLLLIVTITLFALIGYKFIKTFLLLGVVYLLLRSVRTTDAWISNLIKSAELVFEKPAKVFHEISSPLSSLRLSIESMMENNNQNFVLESLESLNYLSEIVARGKGDFISTKFIAVDLNSELTKLANFYRNQNRQLSVGYLSEKFFVRTDKTFFSQILINLINNAFDASEKSVVSVKVRRLGAVTKIIVSNNGRKLSIEEWFKLQQPFVSHKRDHMGLGLPICVELSQKINARLSLAKLPEANYQTSIILTLAVS